VDIISRDDCEPFVTKDTSEIREIMAYRNSSCELTSLAEATLHPGRETEAHFHRRTEEVYYFLHGLGRIRVGEEEREVKPGDAVLIPAGSRHKTWNTCDEDLVFLCVCCPPYEHEDTVMAEEGHS
jgi:mannose-6-phosphate isomerase-like protein (cupin superfamily)